MNAIANMNTKTMMSSLEIAELARKRHAHVLVDIDKLIGQGVIDEPNFRLISYRDSMNRSQRAYNLDFDATMVLVTGYDPHRRMAIIKRWRELESGEAQPSGIDFNDPSQLKQLLLSSIEREEKANEKIGHLTYERDELQRTKAHITKGREGNLFSKVGNLTIENNRLKRQLDIKENYMVTKAVPWAKEYFKVSSGMWIMLGKALAALGREMGYAVYETKHPKYANKIKMHHQDVVARLKQMLDRGETPYHLGQFIEDF